jgi:hypothetical protein
MGGEGLGAGEGDSSTGGGVKGGVFFFFFFFLFFLFFLGPPSFSWGWLEWRSHGLPTLVYRIRVSFENPKAIKILKW